MTEINPNTEKLLRIRQVQEITGLSRSYIYALSEKNQFPNSIPLVPGGTSRAWVYSEVKAWVEQRIAEREKGAASL